MKLVRIGAPGDEKPGVLDAEGRILDLSAVVPDWSGETLAPDILAKVRAALPTAPEMTSPGAGQRFGPPVSRPGKVVCIGVNYADHAAESEHNLPSEPVVFMKAANTVVGPHDAVLIPRGSSKTDWEVELGVVIGATARYLQTADEGLACVAGYAVSHDVSEREFQLERGGQWDKGKSCETFNPLGPWLVTADELPDPGQLDLRLWVNGTERQSGNTDQMIFGVGEIIRYLSQFMVLEPGDVINTGTPSGVALGYPDPKPYLRSGDVIDLEIEGLGHQRQEMRSA